MNRKVWRGSKQTVKLQEKNKQKLKCNEIDSKPALAIREQGNLRLPGAVPCRSGSLEALAWLACHSHRQRQQQQQQQPKPKDLNLPTNRRMSSRVRAKAAAKQPNQRMPPEECTTIGNFFSNQPLHFPSTFKSNIFSVR